MSRIGERIRYLRTMRGLTQKQLGKMVGVSDKFLEEVEAGKRIINDDVLKKVSKVLEQDMDDEMSARADEDAAVKKSESTVKKAPAREVQKLWTDAFDSVLKTVNVYGYDLEKVLYTRQLPVVSNKVEGYPKDKVLFIRIQDNEMTGFRIMEGDIAFGYTTNEIENNSICLVEYEGQRFLRQVKKLDSERALLVSNNGRLMTDTVSVKEIKVLARLERLEIKL